MKIAPIPVIVILSLLLCLPACDQIEQLKEEYMGSHPSGEAGLAEGEHANGEHANGEHVEGEHVEGEHADGEHADGEHAEGHGGAAHKIIVTSPIREDIISTQEYVCQIHSWKHIEIRALEGGYLEKILVKEGQLVNQDELLFKILPILYQAKLDADIADADLMRIKRDNTQRLFDKNIVAQPEVSLAKAELAKAEARVKLSQAELNFANVKAPFGGIVDRQYHQPGSLISEGDVLTTLSDNSFMWVYFNVPEARYLEYETTTKNQELTIQLRLANGTIFGQNGVIGAIEADFNNETGNISFRADFDNPTRLLRHGQTGTVLLSHVEKQALVIPQRATYEILAKKYAFVVGKDNIVRQRDIVVASEKEDIYVIKEGLDIDDRIVLEGIRQVRDGDKVEYEYEAPEEVMKHLKYHAE